MDRKPLPQVEKQNEFFNSLRRKSTMSHSIATPDSSSSKSSIPEKLDEQSITVSASISTQVMILLHQSMVCSVWTDQPRMVFMLFLAMVIPAFMLLLAMVILVRSLTYLLTREGKIRVRMKLLFQMRRQHFLGCLDGGSLDVGKIQNMKL
ncbi:hypothetical protein AAC387_Pa02g2462 [Persea americana]